MVSECTFSRLPFPGGAPAQGARHKKEGREAVILYPVGLKRPETAIGEKTTVSSYGLSPEGRL